MTDKKPTLSRPNDESLESFKAWINELTARLTGSDEDDGSMTEEDWVKMWKEFWSKVD